MRSGDHRAARAALLDLIDRHPDDLLVDAALYDLARMSFADREWDSARRHLDRLISRRRDPALAEPARWLRCRIDVEARSSAARSCIESFRRDYPRSAHESEASSLLDALH
jgi:outer membrane protein assembly factor BamD (BamD/ComL family)